jgi:cytoskeleton protein RodZ
MNNSDDVAASCDFGSVLSQAREAQNFTVDEINMHLKIPVQILIDIEASDVDALPASTYTQGYLRNYAKFLEISEENVLNLYNNTVPNAQITELKPRSSLFKKRNKQLPLIKLVTTLLMVIGVATVLYGIIQYYQEKADDMEVELESKEQSFTGNSLDSPGVNTIEIKQNARLTADGELILENSNSTELAVEEEVVEIESEIDEESIPEAPAQATDTNIKQDILVINAENGSWIEVRDANDDRLFYNMVPKGGSKTLSGQAPFSVSLGNARTTGLMINDIEVDITRYIRSNNTAKFKVSNEEKSVIFH